MQKLVNPEASHEQSYNDYIKELGAENRYPFPLDFEFESFECWLNRIRELELGVNVPKGYVPSSTYFLVEKAQVLAISNLRHYMSPLLERTGGHIGLSVRPSMRGKGLGNVILKQTLAKAKEMEILIVKVYCYKNNLASAKMILSCGGDLKSEIRDQGQWIQRYEVHI